MHRKPQGRNCIVGNIPETQTSIVRAFPRSYDRTIRSTRQIPRYRDRYTSVPGRLPWQLGSVTANVYRGIVLPGLYQLSITVEIIRIRDNWCPGLVTWNLHQVIGDDFRTSRLVRWWRAIDIVILIDTIRWDPGPSKPDILVFRWNWNGINRCIPLGDIAWVNQMHIQNDRPNVIPFWGIGKFRHQ